MKAQIVDKTGKKVGDFDFSIADVDVRDDIFKKAVISEFSLFRQEQGANPLAGKKSALNVLSKRRKRYGTTYGKGGSRTPKKVMWKRGMQMRFVGAFAPNTVGGRKAHPPKSEKEIMKSLNNREWNKAFLTGLSASLNKDLVAKNGQKVPENYPLLFDSNVEEISKTKEFKEILQNLGFSSEIERTSERKVRAGRGTMRSRTYRTKRGPLVVVSSMDSNLAKAARNVQGFDVVSADLLLASDFGMSEKPGRAVIFTKAGAQAFVEVLSS